MLMCVYRHYSKGSEWHAARKRRRREEVYEEKHWKREMEGEKESLCSV